MSQVRRGRTVNISNSGLLLECETALQADIDIELRIALPGLLDHTRRVFLQIKGKTVRVQDNYCGIRIEHAGFQIQPAQHAPFPLS
jgi:hypothetical protein